MPDSLQLFNHSKETFMLLPQVLSTLEQTLSLYSQQAIDYAKNDLWTEESLKQLKQTALLTLKTLQLIALTLITVCIAVIYFPLLTSHKALKFIENKINPIEVAMESLLNEPLKLEIDFESALPIQETASTDIQETNQTVSLSIPKPPANFTEILQTPMIILWNNFSEQVLSKVKEGVSFASNSQEDKNTHQSTIKEVLEC